MAQARPSDSGELELESAIEPTVVQGNRDRTFGKYNLCFELASGGMANVYLARLAGTAGIDKLVAIKRVHSHLARRTEFVEMFLDEARIASLISHPNVCQVYEFGDVEGVFYIAMEYLHGEPLGRVRRALRRQPPDAPEVHPRYVMRIVADACEGLHAAHELKDAQGRPLNVVHRDVSPQNLYVTFDGGVRVVDFGVASAENRIHQTTTGTVKGKFAYMAPEQLRGEHVDRRADVWSLGVVLHELLTQRRLFRRPTESETLFAVVERNVPPPSKLRPDVPPELDAIVMKALARNRNDRYATARDLGRDLTRLLGQYEPVGLGDLAEWMETILGESRMKQRQLIDLARQNESLVPNVPYEPTGSTHTVGGTGVRLRPKRRGLWTLLALGVVAGVAGGVGALLTRSDMSGTGAMDEAAVAEAGEVALAPVAAAQLAAELEPEAEAEGGAVAPSQEAPAATPPAPEVAEEVPEATDEGATAEDEEPEASASSSRRDRRRARHNRRAGRAATPTPEPEAEADPDPEPAPAARGPGTLNVVTPGGWAEVYEKGRLIGQTPLRLELPAGRHIIEIRPFGEKPGKRRTVTVRAGDVQRVSVPVSE